jgi:hypothetical protein
MNSLRSELEAMFASQQSFYSQEDLQEDIEIEEQEEEEQVDEITAAREAQLLSHLLLKPDEPFTLLPKGTRRETYVENVIDQITNRIINKSNVSK